MTGLETYYPRTNQLSRADSNPKASERLNDKGASSLPETNRYSSLVLQQLKSEVLKTGIYITFPCSSSNPKIMVKHIDKTPVRQILGNICV